jgi:hypothetical protein
MIQSEEVVILSLLLAILPFIQLCSRFRFTLVLKDIALVRQASCGVESFRICPATHGIVVECV